MTEQYDSDSEFETKIDSLVKLMRESKHCVIYTGAGISTAANIPDYRGKNGVWTSLEQSFHDFNQLDCKTFATVKNFWKQNGEDIQKCNLTTASPTYSHMALAALVQSGMVKYILSQNCDGLHLRSGISQSNLSGKFDILWFII